MENIYTDIKLCKLIIPINIVMEIYSSLSLLQLTEYCLHDDTLKPVNLHFYNSLVCMMLAYLRNI